MGADCTEQYLLPLAILTYCGAASGQGEDICTAVFGGCTDAECSNYDNSVVWDDGSCVNAAWEDFDVALDTAATALGAMVIVAIAAPIVVIVLLIIICCFCCKGKQTVVVVEGGDVQ